jgi:hypothetical protein
MDIFVAGNFSILFVCRPVCLPVHSGFFFNLINNLQGPRPGMGEWPGLIWSDLEGNLVS